MTVIPVLLAGQREPLEGVRIVWTEWNWAKLSTLKSNPNIPWIYFYIFFYIF